MLLAADQSALLIVDIQAKLMPAVHEADRVIANAAVLMKAAGRLGVPMLVSEQYPKGLGTSVPTIAELAPNGSVLAKTHFSCLRDPAYKARHKALGRRQAVVVGAESHVCVLQTALDLLDMGTQVFVVADAVSSRHPDSKAVALDRLKAAGAVPVTTEMVIFEWLERADCAPFRELSALIK